MEDLLLPCEFVDVNGKIVHIQTVLDTLSTTKNTKDAITLLLRFFIKEFALIQIIIDYMKINNLI